MRRLLDRSGKSVAQIAQELGVHRLTANQWFAGGKRPRTAKVADLARSLETTVEAVILALDRDRDQPKA